MNAILANIIVALVILICIAGAIIGMVKQKQHDSCGCSSKKKKNCKGCTSDDTPHSGGCSGCPYSGSCK